MSVHIEDYSDIAHLIIIARDFSEELDFDNNEQSLIGTVVSELATNIVRYAGSGTLHFKKINSSNRIGILISAEDNGPGIKDISLAILPEYSTGNSLGLGLPSVKRMMDTFKIDSVPGRGTKVVVGKWRNT